MTHDGATPYKKLVGLYCKLACDSRATYDQHLPSSVHGEPTGGPWATHAVRYLQPSHKVMGNSLATHMDQHKAVGDPRAIYGPV